jgi:hypothetical protein
MNTRYSILWSKVEMTYLQRHPLRGRQHVGRVDALRAHEPQCPQGREHACLDGLHRQPSVLRLGEDLGQNLSMAKYTPGGRPVGWKGRANGAFRPAVRECDAPSQPADQSVDISPR